MYSVQYSENVIGMCTVYSSVRLLLVCVQCTVQRESYSYVYSVQCSEIVIGICTVYSAVRLLLVFVQCRVQ